MSPLDDFLKNALRARLIPTVADSRKEERIVSVVAHPVPWTQVCLTRRA